MRLIDIKFKGHIFQYLEQCLIATVSLVVVLLYDY